jgi:hypothetical protein
VPANAELIARSYLWNGVSLDDTFYESYYGVNIRRMRASEDLGFYREELGNITGENILPFFTNFYNFNGPIKRWGFADGNQ